MESYVEFVPAKMARGTIMANCIMSNKELSNHAKVLFTVLSEYARDKNFCYPSYKTLIERMNCSLNSLKKYLRELISQHFVIVENNKFFLFCPKLSNFDKEVSNFDREINIKNLNNTTPPTPSNVYGQKKLACVLKNVEGEFNKFWDCYPRKENKGFALTQFIKLKKKQLLPPFEYFKKAVRFFMDSKQWNRESGRFIPSLANFLANAKWEEVPMEYFDRKELSSHQREEQQAMEELRIKQAFDEAWEKKKAYLRSNSCEKANSEDIKKTWEDIETALKVFTSKFKSESGCMRAITKARFTALYCSGFDFGVIEENKEITPAEFFKNMNKQSVK